MIFRWIVYLPKWTKFSVKKNKILKNTGKVQEFRQSRKLGTIELLIAIFQKFVHTKCRLQRPVSLHLLSSCKKLAYSGLTSANTLSLYHDQSHNVKLCTDAGERMTKSNCLTLICLLEETLSTLLTKLLPVSKWVGSGCRFWCEWFVLFNAVVSHCRFGQDSGAVTSHMYDQGQGQLGEARVREARRAKAVRTQSRGRSTSHTGLRWDNRLLIWRCIYMERERT